jgi:hypothetical protein
MAVAGHDDGSFEFVVDRFLYFFHCRRLVRVPLPLFGEPPGLFVDQFQAIVNRKVLGDVVDDKVEPALEYPG